MTEKTSTVHGQELLSLLFIYALKSVTDTQTHSSRVYTLFLDAYASQAGLQKDRYQGTGGTKEGLSSIGRFRKQQQMLFILAHFYAMWK